ncbi:MAG: DUF1800 domain-containing protein [Betaproteobacteria bacterium]|nr:DUF1800 domain-containing protein [Betaproteobacteria bacterium]
MKISPLVRTILQAFSLLVLALPVHSAVDEPLGADNARHLLNRTGFAASDGDIGVFAKLNRAEAADRLLKAAQSVATQTPPAWVSEPPVPPVRLRDMSPEERQAQQRKNVERAFELREWWFREMLTTPSPLTEKMTLFWHNHFATSQQKVRFTPLIYQQHVMLRRNALGNFGTLLREVARDPAMLIYLDGANSRKEQPNENFAREVMELFTLGEGHYSERDIKEAARAFTGWSVDRDTGQFMFRRGIHDYGNKSVLGKSGNFDGDQVIDILLRKPETAQFVTRKLWREFISPAVGKPADEAQVARFADEFRDSGYNISRLMRVILTSDAFYAPGNRASLIKSPVEFVVGTMKQFDIETPNLRPFVLAAALLGQNVFSPPNVKGWPGGEAWINSATLLGRKQLIDRLFRNEDVLEAALRSMDEMAMRNGEEPQPGREARQRRQMERQMGGIRWNLDKWADKFAGSGSNPVPRQGLMDMTRVVLAVAPQNPPTTSDKPADWARQLVHDPVYQLK